MFRPSTCPENRDRYTAVSEKLDAVLIAGDLLDGTQLSFETERFLLEQFRELADADIQVIYATGNHDPGQKLPPAVDDWPDAVTVIGTGDPVLVEIRRPTGEVVGCVSGVGHTTSHETEDLSLRLRPLANTSLPQVALLHTQVTSATRKPHPPALRWSCPAMTDTFQFGPTKGGEPWREEEEGGIRPSIGSDWSSLRGPGRTPASLAREFGPAEQTIRNWIRRADLDAGLRSDGLTTEARRGDAAPEAGRQAAADGAGHPKKSRGLVREGERIDPRRGYAFMKAHRAMFPLAAMCRVLGLSTSGYHDWLRRPPSARARRDAELKGRIMAAWIESGGIYGCPRIHAALRAGDERVGRKRVARLMRELGIEGVTRRRFRTGTTRRDAGAKAAPDLVNRDFSAEGPDELWVADITQVRTWSGWLYLAVVARRVEPADRRLGDGHADAGRAGGRRAGDGDHDPPAGGSRDPPQRPGLAVHVAGVRPAVPGGGRRAVDGLGGRRVRQRDVRELLRDARVRADRPAAVPDGGRGEARGLQLHRGLPRHPPPPLGSGLSLAGELREAQSCGLRRT